jgi:hypothetical protein
MGQDSPSEFSQFILYQGEIFLGLSLIQDQILGPCSSPRAELEAVANFWSHSSRKFVLKSTNKNFTWPCTPVQPFSWQVNKSHRHILIQILPKKLGSDCASKRCQKIKFFLDLFQSFVKETGVVRGQERCLQGFVRESGGKETTWKI